VVPLILCKGPRLLAIWLAFLATRLYARDVSITILHTCDLHGNVLPTESYEGKTNLGGIARCATAIRRVRAQTKNVLLLDAGDTLQGTAVSLLSDGQVMVKCLNYLHYDAWIWGNHEFDWGLDKLGACADRAEMPILNANVQTAGRGGNPISQRIASRLKPYVLREVDGVKVAIIGLNTPGIPNWSRPRLIDGLKFVDSVETLRKVLPEARAAGAQALVLVCHQGYRETGDDYANQINAIARNFPELDVIIGGHTHRNFPEFKVHNVLYCQADYYGIYLGRIDLVVDTDTGRVVKRQANTLLMDDRIPLDEGIRHLAANETDRAEKVLNTVIGEAAGEFGARAAPRKETPIHDLILRAIAEGLRARGVEVDAVVHGVFEHQATLKKGAITVGDIWRVVPYENTIGVAQLTPAELREVLDENAGAYTSHAFRGIWGLKWVFDPDGRKGERTLALLRPDGLLLADGQRLAVAFNSYDLAGGGTRWKRLRELVDRPEARLLEYDFRTREAVVDYIRKRGVISPTVDNWWTARRDSQTNTASHASRFY